MLSDDSQKGNFSAQDETPPYGQINQTLMQENQGVSALNTVSVATEKSKSFFSEVLSFFSKNWYLFLIGFLILGLFIGGGLFFFKNRERNKKITIRWWGLWEDPAIIEPLIAEYEKTHPNIDIVYERQSQKDYRERLVNNLAKGQGPDIFRFHNTWVPMLRAELDRIPPSVIPPGDFAQIFYPVHVNDLAIEGGIVGIPLEYDALTLFVNVDIFSRNNTPYPKTWDDLRKVAKELTIKDEKGLIKQSGVALGLTSNVDHWPEIVLLMILQNRGDPANPEDKLVENALSFYTLFYQVDQVWDETMPPSTIAFSSGKLAMYFGPSWRAFEIMQQNPSLNFRTIPLPQLPKEKEDEPSVSVASYWVEGVWSKGKNKEAAWDFLKFLSQKDSLEKFYQNAAKVRAFGEPYPRKDMSDLLLDHPILGSIIQDAPWAKSWYLSSRTFDGKTGVNSQIIAYYEDAINKINKRENIKDALSTAADGIEQVLGQFRIAR